MEVYKNAKCRMQNAKFRGKADYNLFVIFNILLHFYHKKIGYILVNMLLPKN